MESTLFTVDFSDNYETMKFYRAITEAKAMMKLKGEIIPCLVVSNGKSRLGFLLLTVDFQKIVRPLKIMEKEETIVRISSDTHQPKIIEHLKTGERKISEGNILVKRFDIDLEIHI
jgi:hypothetical protein